MFEALALPLLTGVVSFTAWAAAARAYPARAIEAFVAHTLYALLLVVGPSLALGWLGKLTASTLTGTVLLCCAVAWLPVFGPHLYRDRSPADFAQIARLCGSVATLPLRAIHAPFSAGSALGLGLLPVAAMCIWTLLLTYLAPPSGWDGLWYHDSIVGFAIQNKGFAWEPVPGNLGLVNGYPKATEMLSLWPAILDGRTWLESPTSILAPMLVAAVYLLLRHFAVWQAGAIGFAALFALTPGVALQLRSTYVDMPFVTVLAATLCFIARPTLRTRDILTAAVGLGLLSGMKATGLLVALVLTAVLVARAIRPAFAQRSIAKRLAFLALAVGPPLLAVALIGGPFYARNWNRQDNPFWPAELHVPALNIDWNGPIKFPNIPIDAKSLTPHFSWPQDGLQHHDTRDNGYGNAWPWATPLIAFGFLLSLKQTAFAKDIETRRQRTRLLLIAVPILATATLSPAWWWARLNLHILLAAMLFIAIAAHHLPRRIIEPLLALGISVSTVAVVDSTPAWGVTPETAWAMAQQSSTHRSYRRLMPRLPSWAVSSARQKELGPDSVVAFTDPYPLPGPLWNEDYSNQVRYIEWSGTQGFMGALDRTRAQWVVVAKGSQQYRAVTKANPAWQRVGTLYKNREVFRRPLEM